MQIEIDHGSGFCFGVTTAIKKAEEELEKGSTLYCLGDIVHNGMEVERLHKTGGVHQREPGKKKKRGSGSSAGKKRTIQSFDPNLPGTYTQVVDVDFSVLAKTTNGKLWHDLFINVDEDYPDVQMTVVVCGEGSDEKLDIMESSVGSPSENTLSGFSLKTGINKVSIRFRDNVKHTLTLEVYED